MGSFATNPTRLAQLRLIAGPLAAALPWLFLDAPAAHPAALHCASVALWMAVWWIGEAVPLSVTALLPLILFPLFGVASGKTIAGAYFNNIILLFIGGFLMAIAMQRWQLHRRIALRILLLFGRSPSGLLLGFMLATAFLSMWISNTATAMLMTPVALAVILRMEENTGTKTSPMAMAILLGIAYSASVGGIATLIGTPPNLSFARILHITFNSAPDITFASWLIFALPFSVIMLASTFFILRWRYTAHHVSNLHTVTLHHEYARLGKLAGAERRVMVAFLVMAGLWLFRAPLDLGFFSLPGWGALLPHPDLIDDGTVAIAVAACLFLLPGDHQGERILDETAFQQMPWHIVLLFGGGFALATGFVESGLSLWIAESLTGMANIPVVAMVAGIALLMTFLTELTSNTATAEMFLPVLAALAVGLGVDPLLLMLPATIAASCAFMLPVATPPNAIVFGCNRLRVSDMARAGLWLNLLGTLWITVFCLLWAPVVLGVKLDGLPTWAVLGQ